MADNFTTPVADGTVLATKDLAGVHIPKNMIVDSAGAEASFYPATQPVSGNVGITGSVAVTGTFYQATQPVSAASLPLPTGASTAAKQPALGTAGAASVDVLTVQGIASMTALKVDGSAVTQPVSIAAPVAVTGTFWQATQPVSQSGTWNITNISGTISLPTGAATEATLAAANAKLPTSLGAKAGSASLSVVPASDAVMPVVSFAALASANFSRPADTTAYASGDLVANSTTAGSVTPLSLSVARVAAGSGMIRRAQLRKSGTSLTNASFRLHLYTASPTLTNGDNGAWLTTVSGYIGSIDITVDKAFSDAAEGIGVPLAGSEINFALASGQTIYGLIEARAAYTPASGETFTVELEVLQN